MSPDRHYSALHAAAVRDVFDPNALKVAGYDAGALAVALIPHVDPSTDLEGRARWSLRTAVRARVLADSDAKQIQRSLDDEGPAVATDRQRVFERWVRGPGARTDASAFVAGLFGKSSTDSVRSVAGWLRDSKWVKPSAREVLKGVTRKSLAEGLRIAAGPRFVGREDELARLGAVIDGGSASRIAAIEALGGMGKSALIAQTLIERHAYGEGAKVIAAVLDFDAATIDPLDPATLFVALVDQLTPQIDGLRGQREIFDSIVAGGRDLARGGRMAIQRGAEDSRLLSEVAALSRELAQRSDQRRLVVVLDTVERALHSAGRLAAARTIALVWRRLLQPITGASLVLAGRMVPDDLVPDRAERIHLGPLDAKSSRRVLKSLGVKPGRAQRASELIAGVPLTLRLAARVLREEGARPLDDPELRSAVEEARVNGYLYRRVLAHLPDKRLGDLADPGLVLRDLTADAIIKVLGRTVSPPVEQPAEAERIIDELVRMEDLFLTVRSSAPLALRVRPEIRGDLIALLRRDRAKFNQFNENAAAYYGRLGTADANAAAAYHLLQLERVDAAAEVVGGKAKLPELLGDAAEELPEGVREALRGRGFSAQRPVVENPLERALHEAAELEKAGRPVLALEQLLGAQPNSDDHAWRERVVHLAGQAGDAKRVKGILATSAVSAVTAAIASDAAGVALDDELSWKVLDDASTRHDRPDSDHLRALLAVVGGGGTAADIARKVLRAIYHQYVMEEIASSEPELARRYVAEVGSEADVMLALELQLLDRTRDLDLGPLLDAVGGDARARRLIEEGQREDNLSRSLRVLLSQNPSLEAPIRELMHRSLRRPSAPSGPTVAVKDRAGALEVLANWITANLDRPAWTALASEVIGSDVAQAETVEVDGRAVRLLLYTIDRRGKMERFGSLLIKRYPAASVLRPALEMLSEARTEKA